MGIKLSISNIAWASDNDEAVYDYMKKSGFSGLEIAPTRILPDNPYEKLKEAKEFSRKLSENYGLTVCSLQSIWHGRSERIFGKTEERTVLLKYTKKVIDFAEAIGAKNLVFGCPKNRNTDKPEDRIIAVEFFKELGDYAVEHGTVLALEANPIIYGTNFINRTQEAIELIREVDSKGFRLNLDFGTMIYYEENIAVVVSGVELINHVHISEPNLKLIEHRYEHKVLMELLRNAGYKRYVSIEMGKREDIRDILNIIDYITAL